MESIRLQVKHLEDVDCPMCVGDGRIDVGTEEYPHFENCGNCRATGQIEIVKEFCPTCGVQLEWNEMEYGFDEDSQKIFRCTANECDRPRTPKSAPIPLEEVPF